MVRIDELAEAALAGDALRLRSLAQDWLAENPDPRRCPPPREGAPDIITVAAALVELFAERRCRPAPPWTRKAGAMSRPVYLVRAAERMRSLRRLCEEESPLPLRRRRLYAPPNFLESA